MEIFEWPSMRVTGSMTMVCRGMGLSEFGGRVGDASFQQLAQYRKDEVSRRRATGDEDIHRHYFVDRANLGQQGGDDGARDLRVERRVLQVRALQYRVGAEAV